MHAKKGGIPLPDAAETKNNVLLARANKAWMPQLERGPRMR